MKKNKLNNVKPSHFALVGLAIIVLGVLVPSFYIDASATIVLSVLIGIILLIVAYVLFVINSRSNKNFKWVLLPACLTILVVSCFLLIFNNNRIKNNKIYSPREIISIGPMEFKITNITEEAVPFNLQGADMTVFNCDNIKYGLQRVGNNLTYDPSNPNFFLGKDSCIEHNNDIKQANEYVAEYDKRMSISYRAKAKQTVKYQDFKIEILADSGRSIVLNAGASTGDKEYSFMWAIGKRDYIANPATDFKGDLNIGLERNGKVSFDLNKDEKIIDFVIKYQNQKRLIRIQR